MKLDGFGRLLQSEWWSAEELLRHQLESAGRLVEHAINTVPFYRSHFKDTGVSCWEKAGIDEFLALPLLKREHMHQSGGDLLSTRIPADHGGTFITTTSGSTGRAVKITNTELTAVYRDVCMLREHYWHRRDLSASLAAIRLFRKNAAPAPGGKTARNWGKATTGMFATGQAFGLDISTDVSDQVGWLQRCQPAYLLTYPSNLHALAEFCRDRQVKLANLKEVRTFGELVNPATRELCNEVWGVKLVDAYSSEEFGYLAVQCPEHEHYHVQSESVLFEILDDSGRPCAPGETGRVVITALHNYAMPLIRYEIGDYAEVGEPCSCGRGLPVVKRILGRVRNMLVFPNGEQRWPLIGFRTFLSIAPIDHYQIVQKTVNEIEVRLVVPRALTQTEEESLTKHLQERMGYPFAIAFRYLGEIPRSTAGKFEEFLSEVRL